jgi:hypothetical protein
VTSPKVANGTLDVDDIKPGLLPKLSGYEIVYADHSYADDFAKSALAICPAGKRVLGAGARIFGPTSASGNVIGQPANVALTNLLVSNDPPGVFAEAWEIRDIDNDWTLQARAVCANL